MAKGKGSSFEREMCRLLSSWWSCGERDDLFWRSAGSGAMAKTRSKVGKATFGQYGDVQATDPTGQPLLDLFTIELKRGYSSETFANMLDKPAGAAKQIWETFADQVMTDFKNAGSKSWMLISRRDRRQALIFIPLSIAMELSRAGADIKSYPHLRGTFALKNGKRIRIYLTTLDDFLRNIYPEHIKKILENEKCPRKTYLVKKK